MLRSRCSRSVSSGRFLVAALALLTACGGGGSGGGSSSGGGTGSVAVLFTDGPVDPTSFSHIFVTFTGITLIGEGGQIRIFDGEETVDLRDVEDTATLVSVGRDVPAGDYEKIRLDVEEIELVSAHDGSSSFPKLPPKLDLNPRGGFHVSPGELVLVQIDVDAGKSIHIVETGSGGLRFRPVVFVDVLTRGEPGRLVLLQGEVEEVGDAGFLLCDTHAVSRQGDGVRTTMRGGEDDQGEDENEDDQDREDFCIDVHTSGDTSFFDENGDPAELGDVSVGEHASVLGRFLHQGESLDFDAEVVQLGEDVTAVDGEVASEVGSDHRFDLDLDAGQGITTDDGLLAIQLQPGTRLFTRDGEELAPTDLQVGDAARAFGVLSLSSSSEDVLKAAAVVVDVASGDTSHVEGEITSVMSGGARIEVDTDSASECVDVPADADVFAITSQSGSSQVDAIDRSELAVGDEVSVFGTPGSSCLQADTVIVLDDE